MIDGQVMMQYNDPTPNQFNQFDFSTSIAMVTRTRCFSYILPNSADKLDEIPA